MAGLRFKDRTDAGAQLAEALAAIRIEPGAVVLGLPRGGIPVGYEVARRLHLQLDFLNIRKLGVPWQPEVAMGAVGEDGVPHLNADLVRSLAITSEQIKRIRDLELSVIRERKKAYRGFAPTADLQGRQVILVDDGIATGATMDLAIEMVRTAGARSLIVAIPAGPPGTSDKYEDMVDHCICLQEPAEFNYVGQFYRNYQPVTDDEVCELLGASFQALNRGAS
ncbi:phosphoribosyltransferase [Marinobacter pelagius]|uniref:phosphoribosyltransferase n=1 Tax=Marinobacter sp. C7 TaxID=2951363 RepID=UPI001EF13B80|nr:phosphoribosyltransferase family protein [Marinobacter sp. C7]MCG7199736.1 phosphoribosyltransferase [Marinobacter sp. C7]